MHFTRRIWEAIVDSVYPICFSTKLLSMEVRQIQVARHQMDKVIFLLLDEHLLDFIFNFDLLCALPRL
jgi:hypothetical protein